MPFKSRAQQRFMHAAAARGDISPSVVSEFDSATKGKFNKLPEHVHRANGGTMMSRMASGGKVGGDATMGHDEWDDNMAVGKTKIANGEVETNPDGKHCETCMCGGGMAMNEGGRVYDRDMGNMSKMARGGEVFGMGHGDMSKPMARGGRVTVPRPRVPHMLKNMMLTHIRKP